MPQIAGAFSSYVMQKLGGDKDPTASVLGGGKISILGELLDLSFAASEERSGPFSVNDRVEPRG